MVRARRCTLSSHKFTSREGMLPDGEDLGSVGRKVTVEDEVRVLREGGDQLVGGRVDDDTARAHARRKLCPGPTARHVSAGHGMAIARRHATSACDVKEWIAPSSPESAMSTLPRTS
eukprot:1613066-Rhodomonas_salina.4